MKFSGFILELYYQASWIVEIMLALLIVDNVNLDLQLHSWWDMPTCGILSISITCLADYIVLLNLCCQ